MDEKFAEAFRVARQAAGLSQAEVAARMADFGYDTSQPVIGKIERGERRVTIGEGEALSAIVGRSTTTLLNGPTRMRVELGVEHLRARRQAIKDAVERFQSAQLVLAQVLDIDERNADRPDRLSRFEGSLAAALLEETPKDILEEYEKDVRAEMEGHRIRDRLDEGAEEYDSSSLLAEDDSPRLFRLMSERGDAVDSRIGALGYSEAWAAVRGADLEGQEVAPDAQAADTAQ